jgi:DNA adenine methylase
MIVNYCQSRISETTDLMHADARRKATAPGVIAADTKLSAPSVPASPLRYPGGKARLAGLLATTMEKNNLRGSPYYEPYVGGAGAALALLASGAAETIHLNDKDRRIFSFWRAVLDETGRFADRIFSSPLNIAEWKRQRAICAHPRGHSTFDIGFAAFYMNRCNRSGILDGAGPIGGYDQTGVWKLDVRFNRSTLAERVVRLGLLRRSIYVSNQDGIEFLTRKLPKGGQRSNLFVYLDPPYVNNGHRLYLNSYVASDHAKLARYLKSQKRLPWLMSYDDSTFVRELYATCKVTTLPLRYSLQEKRSSHELILSPSHLALAAGFQSCSPLPARRKAHK